MSNSNLSTFKQRVISSVAMLVIIALLFLFISFSDVSNNWSPVNLNHRDIFAWLFLLLIAPLIFFGCKEISIIFFKKDKFAFIFLLILLILTIYPQALILLFYKYKYFIFPDIRFTYIISIFISIIISIIFLIIFMYFYGLFDIKKIFTQLFLFLALCGLLSSIIYFSLIKSWTTVLMLLIIPVFTDTFAYIGGKMFGRDKLSPFISPKKTIQGAIIGITIATFISIIILVLYSFDTQHNMLKNFFGIQFKNKFETTLPNEFASFPLWWVSVIFLIIFLSIFSIFGDLSFSSIKRRYNIKDFSNLIPGHGGVLDRLDSHTFVFSAYFIISILIGYFSKTVTFL